MKMQNDKKQATQKNVHIVQSMLKLMQLCVNIADEH